MKTRSGFALLLAFLATGCGATVEADLRPSIVLIVADTLRADYIGYRGLGPGITPNLDAFAETAVDFEQAYSVAPWTKPSIATLMTGVSPAVHGVTNHDGRFWSREGAAENTTGALAEEFSTLADVLGEQGYETAAFVANAWLARGYGFEQGFDRYEDDISRDQTGGVFARADRWFAERSGDRPVFAYIHAMEPHAPYDVPARFVDQARGAALGASRVLTAAQFDAIPAVLRASEWTSAPAARDLREWRTRYAAGVVAFDHGLGVFLDRLGRLDQEREVAVIVTADHGEELFDHGGWDHGVNLYDHQLHVPLLLRLPGVAPRQVTDLVSLVDLYPTVLDLVDATGDVRAQGRGLLAVARGMERREGASVHASATTSTPGLHGLRTSDAKLLYDTTTGGAALYDLAADPGETRNVASDRLPLAESLVNALQARLADAGTRAVAPPQVPVDPELAERLTALGYVDP